MPGGCHLYIRIAILYIETTLQQVASPDFRPASPPGKLSGPPGYIQSGRKYRSGRLADLFRGHLYIIFGRFYIETPPRTLSTGTLYIKFPGLYIKRLAGAPAKPSNGSLKASRDLSRGTSYINLGALYIRKAPGARTTWAGRRRTGGRAVRLPRPRAQPGRSGVQSPQMEPLRGTPRTGCRVTLPRQALVV
jgi:hypothetical protein